jgi:hypothetical protein
MSDGLGSNNSTQQMLLVPYPPVTSPNSRLHMGRVRERTLISAGLQAAGLGLESERDESLLWNENPDAESSRCVATVMDPKEKKRALVEE